MRYRFSNLKLVLSSWTSIIVGLIFAALFGAVIYDFTDRALIAGNYGETYALVNLTLDVINIIGIGFFVSSVVYKFSMFRTIDTTSYGGWFGGFFAALASGCASCSITLATYLGLGALLTALPRGGLEVKIVGTLILIRSLWKSIRDLMMCKKK